MEAYLVMSVDPDPFLGMELIARKFLPRAPSCSSAPGETTTTMIIPSLTAL
jgi:hypothetical protein